MKSHVRKMVTQEQFADQTSIVIPVIVSIVQEQEKPNLSQGEWEWFQHHVDVRVRYLYVTNKLWKRSLKGEGGRDRLYVFVQHWLKAYVKDTARYQHRHPHGIFNVLAPAAS